MIAPPRGSFALTALLNSGLVAFTVLFIALRTPVFAQSFQGGIRGSVHDAVGVVRDAEMRLVEDSTQVTRVSRTNDSGEYVFSAVVPGTYTLHLTVPGYRTYSQTNLRVGTQEFLNIDVVLQVGNVSEVITVEGRTSPLSAATASVSSLVDRTMIASLPSAGRNVFYLSTLAPTVVYTGDAQFVRQQDQSNSSLLSLGGGPRRNNTYVLDGVPVVDLLNRATLIPSFHAVEEMRVQLSAYDAEIGRTSGGVFNVIARSGSNTWRGEGLYQNRPSGTLGRLYFAAKNDVPNPHTYYHLFGGSLGGPIAHNRTFFFASTEGYRTLTTRSTVLVLPTLAERQGDFSQSAVTIYDPLTTRLDPSDPRRFIRDPFPGNRIPADRLNLVARSMLPYVPEPLSGTTRPVVAGIVDRANQVTGKLTHRWSDTLTSSGLYGWYSSQEPDARFYGGDLFKNGADPGDGALVRTVHLVASNHTWVPNSRTSLAVRYGFNRFVDDDRPASFDPSALGFDTNFLSLVPLAKFPRIGVSGYGRGGSVLGDRDRGVARHYSQDVNASLSRLIGRHVLKTGGEYRLLGVRVDNIGGSGFFAFDRGFASGPDPNAPMANGGNAFASFLLGYPSAGGIQVSVPVDLYLRDWSGFAQDEFRVTPKLTATFGLRYEYEEGLQEREDRLAVGWAYDTPFPIQIGGTRPDGPPLTLTGGIRYAGVGGAPTHQGNPSVTQFGPRAGLVYALSEQTLLRGGYGLFFAPSQGIEPSPTRGYQEQTAYVATLGNPFIPCDGCSLSNPFPHGLNQPVGNSPGVFTGVGGGIHFVDPNARMGRFQRYSFDVQRLLPYSLELSIGYLGARGDHLSSGVQASGININQLDPKFLARGAELQQPVANPFYGTPLGVGILSGPTVSRAQLLRPYPQFDSVFVQQPDVARSLYHAFILAAQRRFGNGWSTQANYTWSRLKDNQFADSNFFAGGSSIVNNYDVNREYGLSVVDTPHHLNVSATVELPFGSGRQWLNGRRLLETLLGGWMISAVVGYQSGFPITLRQSPNNADLLGNGQRPNVVEGVNPRLSNDYDPSCRCIRYLNPAAWSQAGPFTFGNAPRADGRARTPAQRSFDLAIEKSHRVSRSTVAVRAELINVFNLTNLRGPSIAFGDPSFGQIREAAGFPRLLQVSIRAGW